MSILAQRNEKLSAIVLSALQPLSDTKSSRDKVTKASPKSRTRDCVAFPFVVLSISRIVSLSRLGGLHAQWLMLIQRICSSNLWTGVCINSKLVTSILTSASKGVVRMEQNMDTSDPERNDIRAE